MAIRIVFVTDTHLGFDLPVRPRVKKERRGEDFFRNFQSVLEHAVSAKADLVIHGGDLFFRSKVPPAIVDRAYRMIGNFLDYGIPLIIIPGNHDRSTLPQSLFLVREGLHIAYEPKAFSFVFDTHTLQLDCIPFHKGKIRNDFPEITGNFPDKGNSFRILCLHEAIEGATVGPADFTFRDGDNVVKINDIPSSYDCILVGHIHRSQVLFTEQGIPVIHAGSIERTSMAEKDEQKGFVELVLSIHNPLCYRFIPLPARPMKDLVIPETCWDINSLSAYLKEELKKMPQHSVVRIKPGKGSAELLTAQFLRDITPPGMILNISYSRTFR